VENGILKGDLIIRASGDPGFGGQIDDKNFEVLLSEMLDAVSKAGIERIEGRLEMQLPGNRYPAHGSWPIEDIGNYYGTGAWGFNFNDNLYKLHIKTGNPGEPLEIVRTEPSVPGLKIINRGITAPPDGDDTSYLYADPLSYTQTLIGQIPKTDSLYVIKGGIPNPPKTFLSIFYKKLYEHNINIEGDLALRYKHHMDKNEKIIWKHQSPPLLKIAKRTIDKSVNLYSEALARLIIEKNRISDHYLNKDSINVYFRNKGFRLIDLEDGSGLAPDNMIAPVEFTAFFKRLTEKRGRAYVLDILSQGGKDGYAKYFLRKSPVQSQIWLKSGSVSKVMNYVGVFKARSGKYYAFAIMVNHFEGKHKSVKKAIERYAENLIMKL
jgi:D-alanyl-D-alanine carboxypeptidase/D-alanyl-D-alanine-endopeptidase (penicillin-binding protein 4)